MFFLLVGLIAELDRVFPQSVFPFRFDFIGVVFPNRCGAAHLSYDIPVLAVKRKIADAEDSSNAIHGSGSSSSLTWPGKALRWPGQLKWRTSWISLSSTRLEESPARQGNCTQKEARSWLCNFARIMSEVYCARPNF